MRQKMKKKYPEIEQNMIQKMKEQVKNKWDLLRTYRCSRKTMKKKNMGEKIIKATFKKIFHIRKDS